MATVVWAAEVSGTVVATSPVEVEDGAKNVLVETVELG